MRSALLALLVAACHPQPNTAMTSWPKLDDKLLADAAATFNWRLGTPTPLAITRDGAVLFRRTPPRDFASDLYELSADGKLRTLATTAALLGTGQEQLSDAEKARRERTRTATRGVVDADVSEDGKTVLVPLGGKLYLIDRASGKRSVIDPGGAAYDPHLSPDGTTVAFVRDGDVWIASASGAPRQLTRHPEGFEYGVADFAAQEELRRTRGFWWSPDGTQIVFQRSDLRKIETIYVADARHNDRPPVPFKYPRAGTPNAIVDLGILGVRSPGEPRWLSWDHTRYEYLVSVQWTPNAPLTALVINRDQTDLALLRFDPETEGEGAIAGKAPRGETGAGKAILTEHDDAWLNVDVGAPRWLEDGSGFLWMTEAPGQYVLELHAPDGAPVRALTTPEFGLRELRGIVDHAAIVEASADPVRQDVWRVPLDGGAPVRLSDGDGVASAVAAKHGSVVIDTLLHAGGRKLVAITQGTRRDLPSAAERPSLAPTTALETVELAGRTHHVAITRPRDFDRTRRYPVLLKVYAGPHAVTVEDARDTYVMDQWYADAGFIVVRADGRGTPNRGRAWERTILKDLITVPLEDQVAALQAMGARHPELDMTRVGVFGWSFGGYFSTLAVLLRPDVFKCAVAGAPVTDWSLYDTAYTERYMKTPQANPDGYRSTSALTHAAKLSRPLLVIHGITDDNVHFAHTLSLIEALYVAGKRAEVITLSATHMVPDPKLNLAREQVQIDFFRQHLGPP
ncbi:MAG TPA: prolyl oligopeptidase family serine peptidase [Kofleriaceae bacterium]|nr:prolyl oligopeptidase family serine peptidase [Kofleriaceae bacterium]